jgi:fermentation-respiration switch protein FrsA (DUF1100 family)
MEAAEAEHDILDAYRRARGELPAVTAEKLAGNAVDGYWIDADRFFFVTEHRVEADRIVPWPFLATRSTGTVRPVLELDEMLALLRTHAPGLLLSELQAVTYDCPEPGQLVAGLRGQYVVIDVEGRSIINIEPEPKHPESLSPCGRFAVFLSGFDLILRDKRSGEERPLTVDGEADWPYGQQPQASLTSVAYRRRPQPVVLWSADGQWLLTHRIDERHLPERVIVESAPPGVAPIAHRFRYSTAADPAPLASLVAIHLGTARVVSTPQEPVYMFAPLVNRWAWFADKSRVCYIRGDRHQRKLELFLLDLETGQERILCEEHTHEGYLELHPLLGHPPNVRYLPESEEIIWWSERSGWGHLYLLDAETGKVKRSLTQGSWQVRDIIDVDALSRTVLIAACGLVESDPVLRTLARVSLDTSEVQIWTYADERGEAAARPEVFVGAAVDHRHRPRGARVSVSPDQEAVVLRRSCPAVGSVTQILDLHDGNVIRLADTEASILLAPAPISVDVLAADGVTHLRAALYLPRDHDGRKHLPIVDVVYPGPQSVLLPRTFWSRAAGQAQAIAELGFAALITDSRGLPFRSRVFHQAGYGDLLEPQMADHVSIIGQLCTRFEFLDRGRVGIVGSSAGGAATAYALLQYPEVFHAGVALCGPYDPADYLGGWMLKYVGPDVEGAWQRQRIGRLANRLAGKLMLVHGDLDDNVHPSQSVRLARDLIAAGKKFEFLLVPGGGHLLQLTNPYVQQRIWDFFVTHLLGDEPPSNFRLDYEPLEMARFAHVGGREALWV